MSHDDIISMFLKRRDPNDHDDFMEACGRAIADAVPAARRMLSPYQHILDIDEIIGRAYERALHNMYRQFLGANDGFHFKPESGITFQTWFLQIVGRPGRGAKSGLAGSEFNRTIRERGRQVSLDDALSQVSLDDALKHVVPDDDTLEDTLNALEHALARLPPREQFVVRARSGVHDAGPLDSEGIPRLSAMVRLSDPPPRVMRRRARTIVPPGRLPSACLSSNDIGHLLEIGDRQVRNINESALKMLRRD